jgi:hypothetical protein
VLYVDLSLINYRIKATYLEKHFLFYFFLVKVFLFVGAYSKLQGKLGRQFLFLVFLQGPFFLEPGI